MRPAARRWCASATEGAAKGDRNAVYMLRTFGGEAHEIWNVADPANRFSSPGSAAQGYAQELVECEPALPFWCRRAGLAHARMTRSTTSAIRLVQRKSAISAFPVGAGLTGAVPTELHGPISTGRKATASISVMAQQGRFLQIVDRDKLINGPKEPTAIIFYSRKFPGWRCPPSRRQPYFP